MFKKILKGTLILTIFGIITKLIGFYYRIFIAENIGATGVGIYQMALPLLGLFAAIGNAGIELTTSLIISESKTKKSELINLRKCFFVSIFLSTIATVLLVVCIPFIGNLYPNNMYIEHMLFLLSPTILLMSLHSVISGYFLSKNNTINPGVSLCLENLSKLLFIMVFVSLCDTQKYAITPIVCAVSILFSEIISTGYSFIGFFRHKRKYFKPDNIQINVNMQNTDFIFRYKEIIKLIMPISFTRTLLSFIHSFESTLIPILLIYYGYSEEFSIGLFGTITGMSLPFILFPLAITTSLSQVLLPSISNAVANNDVKTISYNSSKAIQFSMALGIFLTGLFLTFGNNLGIIFFNSKNVGYFLTLFAWLCPFIYVEVTMSSIIHGFGLTKTTCVYNIISSFIRVITIILIVPNYGIIGYLIGILIGEVTNTILTAIKVKKLCHLHYSLKNNLFKPVAYTIISVGFGLVLGVIVDDINIFPHNLVIILNCIISCLVFFGLFYFDPTIRKVLPDIHNN